MASNSAPTNTSSRHTDPRRRTAQNTRIRRQVTFDPVAVDVDTGNAYVGRERTPEEEDGEDGEDDGEDSDDDEDEDDDDDDYILSDDEEELASIADSEEQRLRAKLAKRWQSWREKRRAKKHRLLKQSIGKPTNFRVLGSHAILEPPTKA